MSIRKVDSFSAMSNDGHKYTIIVWQKFTETRDGSGIGESPGHKTYKTSDEESLTPKSKNEFKFVHKDIILTRMK